MLWLKSLILALNKGVLDIKNLTVNKSHQVINISNQDCGHLKQLLRI